jgi:hypothetical protein
MSLTLRVSTGTIDIWLAGEMRCLYPDCEAKLGAHQLQGYIDADGKRTLKGICDGPGGCHRDVIVAKFR